MIAHGYDAHLTDGLSALSGLHECPELSHGNHSPHQFPLPDGAFLVDRARLRPSVLCLYPGSFGRPVIPNPDED